MEYVWRMQERLQKVTEEGGVVGKKSRGRPRKIWKKYAEIKYMLE